MAVAVVARYPDLTPETYDQVIASLDLDVNPPAGAIFHMAADGVGGVVASEIWQTEQTFRAFLDYRLRPALRMHGVHRDPVVEVSGVALTKLDGSAKGGVAVAIAYELGLPVKLVGVGERLEDLRPFDPDDFARAFFDESLLGGSVAA